MSLLVKRSPLTKALLAMLNAEFPATESGGLIDRYDVGRAPDTVPKNRKDELVHGYGLIYPITSPIMWGSLSDPEDTLTATYQVTHVGRTAEHAQNIADKCHEIILTRGANGLFTNGITVAGHTVLERRCVERGTVIESSGALWEVPDTYDLEVQAVP